MTALAPESGRPYRPPTAQTPGRARRPAAAELGLEVVVLPKSALQGTGDRITVVSEAAKACLGIPSVAEAAALAAAGPGSRLLVPRIAVADATCAVAAADPA